MAAGERAGVRFFELSHGGVLPILRDILPCIERLVPLMVFFQLAPSVDGATNALLLFSYSGQAVSRFGSAARHGYDLLCQFSGFVNSAEVAVPEPLHCAIEAAVRRLSHSGGSFLHSVGA